MPLDSYLFFADGRAEEAIGFYTSALDAGTEMLMRFSDSPDPVPPEMIPGGDASRIMHACLRIAGARLMISDGGCGDGPGGFQGFSLTLSFPDVGAVESAFAALGDGGAARMPLGPTFFSPAFGMLTDRFGVPWSLLAEPRSGG
jgi:PhnB protein